MKFAVIDYVHFPHSSLTLFFFNFGLHRLMSTRIVHDIFGPGSSIASQYGGAGNEGIRRSSKMYIFFPILQPCSSHLTFHTEYLILQRALSSFPKYDLGFVL